MSTPNIAAANKPEVEKILIFSKTGEFAEYPTEVPRLVKELESVDNNDPNSGLITSTDNGDIFLTVPISEMKSKSSEGGLVRRQVARVFSEAKKILLDFKINGTTKISVDRDKFQDSLLSLDRKTPFLKEFYSNATSDEPIENQYTIVVDHQSAQAIQQFAKEHLGFSADAVTFLPSVETNMPFIAISLAHVNVTTEDKQLTAFYAACDQYFEAASKKTNQWGLPSFSSDNFFNSNAYLNFKSFIHFNAQSQRAEEEPQPKQSIEKQPANPFIDLPAVESASKVAPQPYDYFLDINSDLIPVLTKNDPEGLIYDKSRNALTLNDTIKSPKEIVSILSILRKLAPLSGDPNLDIYILNSGMRLMNQPESKVSTHASVGFIETFLQSVDPEHLLFKQAGEPVDGKDILSLTLDLKAMDKSFISKTVQTAYILVRASSFITNWLTENKITKDELSDEQKFFIDNIEEHSMTLLQKIPRSESQIDTISASLTFEEGLESPPWVQEIDPQSSFFTSVDSKLTFSMKRTELQMDPVLALQAQQVIESALVKIAETMTAAGLDMKDNEILYQLNTSMVTFIMTLAIAKQKVDGIIQLHQKLAAQAAKYQNLMDSESETDTEGTADQ